MPVMDRKSEASLIIAEVFGCDWDDVRECIYQPTVYKAPRIYSWNDEPWSYLCAPNKRQRLPKGFKWELVGYSPFEGHKNRPVYGVKYSSLGENS